MNDVIEVLQLSEVGTMNIFVHWINEDGDGYIIVIAKATES